MAVQSSCTAKRAPCSFMSRTALPAASRHTCRRKGYIYMYIEGTWQEDRPRVYSQRYAEPDSTLTAHYTVYTDYTGYNGYTCYNDYTCYTYDTYYTYQLEAPLAPRHARGQRRRRAAPG